MTAPKGGRFALIALASVLATGAWLVLMFPRWAYVWPQTGQALSDSLTFTGPAAAVLAAAAAGSFRRSGLDDLAASAARPRSVVLTRDIGRLALPVGSGYLTAAVGALAVTARQQPIAEAPWLHVLVGLAACGFFLVLGYAIGRLIRHVTAPLV